MRSRRLGRFVLEVCFLAGLATLATLARLHPAAVIGVMAFGWVVVALAEWSAWLDRPHFGRGLPPRYYLPQVSLPPPVARERASALQLDPSPGAAEEETWAVSASDWAAAFAGWPVLAPDDDLAEQTIVAALEALAGEPPGALDELAASAAGAATDAPTEFVAAEHELPPPEQPASAVPLPPELAPPAREQPRPAPSVPGPEPVAVRASAAGAALARHRVDPFAPAPGTRWWRRRDAPGGVVELPDRPPPDRAPPAALDAGTPRGR